MNNKNTEVKEDFYFNEEGYMVFTAAYHLKRGYCCKNGCRHCPYGFNKEKEKLKNAIHNNKKT